MNKQARKPPAGKSKNQTSSDYAPGLRILARILARRHIRNQLDEINGDNDENTISHDGDSKTLDG